MTNSIGKRTRDLPACSTVSQPTAPPRAPQASCLLKNVQTYPGLRQQAHAMGIRFSLRKDKWSGV
jgi:hypothetical protein